MQDCGDCERDIITVYVSSTLSSLMLIYFETQQDRMRWRFTIIMAIKRQRLIFSF